MTWSAAATSLPKFRDSLIQKYQSLMSPHVISVCELGRRTHFAENKQRAQNVKNTRAATSNSDIFLLSRYSLFSDNLSLRRFPKETDIPFTVQTPPAQKPKYTLRRPLGASSTRSSDKKQNGHHSHHSPRGKKSCDRVTGIRNTLFHPLIKAVDSNLAFCTRERDVA
ncbi:unnamed protein product [Trichogramma brassicae]|uniref:Uncharacterized protein n=1 Tax=Trichogramma brassicae TaxID=86971 RepID=A0A6H5IXQ8_9HYME|nr:unnamed protein product [Trichogramma brassicae]